MPVTLSIKVVRDIMERYQLQARKGLGQNFLVDQNILTRIAEGAEIDAQQLVVEIGPGLGSLSRELAARGRGLLAIDIDQRLEPVLAETLAEYEHVRLIFSDILKIDIETALMESFQLKEAVSYKVCANIPYNITTPIIFKLLESCPHMESAILMMQKEVAERILALPGTKDYGRLTIATSYYAKVERVLSVSRHCFYPQPEVDSAVLRFIPYNHNRLAPETEMVFKNILNYFFQQRRKIILNSLVNLFKIDKITAEEKLKTLGLDPKLRPENLDLRDYLNLAETFSQINGNFC